MHHRRRRRRPRPVGHRLPLPDPQRVCRLRPQLRHPPGPDSRNPRRKRRQTTAAWRRSILSAMATELRSTYTATPQDLAEYQSFDAYEDWQRHEGVRVVTGFYIEDLKTLELSPWPRKGGRGAFVNLEGTGGVNDMHVVEIAPRGQSRPERHLYEEMGYVLTRHGSTAVWYDENRKQSLEGGPGAVFAL